MEFNPNRSWAVTYNQMWNLSMTNPIMNNGHSHQCRSFGSNNVGSNANSSNANVGIKKKLNYCWSFNKGVKCKFGRKCKFIERCSYCDEASHGVVNCAKLDKKDKDSARGGKKNRTSR